MEKEDWQKFESTPSASSNEEIPSSPPKKTVLKRLVQGLLGAEDDDDIANTKAVSFRQLFRYAERRDVILMFFGVVFSILQGVFLSSLNVFSGFVVTLYISTKDPVGNADFIHTALVYVFCYLGIGIICFLLATFEHLSLLWASERITARIKLVFIKSVLGQDSSFMDSTSSGALSNQLNSNIERIREGLGDKIGMLCRSASIYFSTVTIAFILDWRIALIMVWTGPICVLSTALTPMFTSASVAESLKITEEANGLAEECILNVKTVAACNGEEIMIEKYSQILRNGMRPSIKVGMISGFFEGFFFFALYVFYVAGFWYGTVGYHNGWIADSGTVVSVVNLLMYSSYLLGLLGPHMMAVLKARAAAAVVYQTIDKIPEIDVASEEGLELKHNEQVSIEFEEVQFSYKTRETPVLQGLSWSVQPGETVALVGQSGCGKSTSIGLITRMIQSGGGEIRINGKPIEQYNARKLRKMIGVVSQEPSLFNGTIRENIRLGRELSDSEIERAARTANAHEFIGHLEQGYDTLLGPAGVALSGGQKQRIAIARAIVTDPSILLLDEATSALDSKSERVVQLALQRASAGRTTVVIAHRLSTIKDVNRVYVIGEGRVIEEGGYDELRDKPDGIFARMLSMQDVTANKNDIVKEDEIERISHDPFVRQRSILSSGRSAASLLSEVGVPDCKEEEGEFPHVDGSMWKLLTGYKSYVIKQIAVSVFRGMEMVVLVFVANIVYRTLAEDDYYTLMLISNFGQLVIGLLTWIAIFGSRVTGAWVSESILTDLRIKCFSSIIHRPIKYFDRSQTSPAACSVMLSQQVPLVSAPIDYRISLVYENSAATFIIIILCFCFSWPNGFVALLVAFLFIGSFLILERLSDKANTAVDTIDTSAELAVEIFEHAKTIQVLSVEEFFTRNYQEILEKKKKPLLKKTLCRALVHALSQSFSFFSNFLATGLGSLLIYSGYVTALSMYTSEMCVIMIGWAVMMMSGSFNDLISANAATKRMFALIDPTWKERGEGEEPDITGSVAFKNVSFAYPSRPQHTVASKLNFSLRKGESLALVGPSGGGKSTVVNLLERFYEPTGGRIELDSNLLSKMSRPHLRSKVSLVGQEPVLFRGTIKENITLGLGEITADQVIEACRSANAANFIEQFPMGYDTIVGEKGGSLSGGQKQRIAIARALIRDPQIILLDEATSALDTQSEKAVKKALEVTAVGRTSITIAHRLDTISNCDRICFIESGKIVESGTHSELIEADGKYAALVREQTLS